MRFRKFYFKNPNFEREKIRFDKAKVEKSLTCRFERFEFGKLVSCKVFTRSSVRILLKKFIKVL